MRKSSASHSEAGKKGAEAFWNKFYNDPQFQERIRKSWKGHRVNRQRISEAARLGYQAFRKRYNSDADFRKQMDDKLAISRSKGGTISLRNLGEEGFKKRFEGMRSNLLRYKYTDNKGNRLRSKQELKVANLLSLKDISYVVEPRFVCGPRTFFPDFLVQGSKQKIIEVMGIGTEEYWIKAQEKVKLLTAHCPEVEILIITSYSKKAKTYLNGISRVNVLLWKELDKVANWCWDTAPG